MTCVALLRAVNVAGYGRIAMSDLCTLAAALGLGRPRTVVQSGNLVFETTGRTAEVERRLEEEAAARLGLRTTFFVRDAKEWHEVIRLNPFPAVANEDPARLHVMILDKAPRTDALAALQAGIRGRERMAAGGRHLYITYPDGAGRSRLTGTLIEKTLAARGTARNWNTVLKIGDLL